MTRAEVTDVTNTPLAILMDTDPDTSADATRDMLEMDTAANVRISFVSKITVRKISK